MSFKKCLILCGVLALCSCGNTTSSISSSTQPSPTSQAEGLYTKMTRGFENLSNSFTAEGTLEYVESDGSTTSQDNYMCLIEVGEDSYYYEESDLLTSEVTVVENYYENAMGEFCSRELDVTTNKVNSYSNHVPYSSVMYNPFKDAVVKDLNTIKGQLNWYEISNHTRAAEIVYFLTGYDVNYLTISQFAMHFDGDNFDQFRFLLEYAEDDYDDGYSYYAQFLFTLNIFDYGETTPSTIEPYERVEQHDVLEAWFDEMMYADNFTVNVDVSYSSEQATPEHYSYYVDMANQMMLSTETRYSYRYDEKADDYVTYPYNRGYKTIKVGGEDRLYMYYFDLETKELVTSYDYNEYMGITDSSLLRTFYYMSPKIGLIAPECYKYNGDYFSYYYLTQLYCWLAMVPYDEVPYGSCEMKLFIDDNGVERLDMISNVYYYISDSYYIRTTMTVSYTYTNINTTVIDSCLVNA